MATTTYLTTAQRSDLINQYMECWFNTHSYSTEEAAERDGAEMKAILEAMPNPKLHAEMKASGWGII
jgi:hypothetical protein